MGTDRDPAGVSRWARLECKGRIEMAYDERLADRIRGVLRTRDGVTERKMFGGIGFMLNGNMAVGVTRDELMVRVAPDTQDDALAQPHVRVMNMGDRPMRGMVGVAPAGVETDADLARWVDAGADVAAALPPK
jgi:TfoX/Sxy family transcriptional regulator of competence genes